MGSWKNKGASTSWQVLNFAIAIITPYLMWDNVTVSLNPSTNGKALLLTSGTEVSIAPKTRGKVNGTASPAARTEAQQKVDAKAKEAKEAEEQESRIRVLRTLPSRILSSMQPSCPSLDKGSVAAVGFVSRTFLNELAGQSLFAKPNAWIASIDRLPPPIDPSQEQSGLTASPIPPAAPRVLLAQDPDAPRAPPSVAVDEVLQNQIIVSWSAEVPVPDDHVLLHGSVGGVEDWDYVK